MAKKQTEIPHLASLETPRKEKEKSYPIRVKSGSGLCLEPKQNGRMGHCPESYVRNHYNRNSAETKRVYLNAGILSFKTVKLTNRRIQPVPTFIVAKTRTYGGVKGAPWLYESGPSTRLAFRYFLINSLSISSINVFVFSS